MARERRRRRCQRAVSAPPQALVRCRRARRHRRRRHGSGREAVRERLRGEGVLSDEGGDNARLGVDAVDAVAEEVAVVDEVRFAAEDAPRFLQRTAKQRRSRSPTSETQLLWSHELRKNDIEYSIWRKIVVGKAIE